MFCPKSVRSLSVLCPFWIAPLVNSSKSAKIVVNWVPPDPNPMFCPKSVRNLSVHSRVLDRTNFFDPYHALATLCKLENLGNLEFLAIFVSKMVKIAHFEGSFFGSKNR